MLPCSGNNLAIPYDSDPPGNDILSIMGGHLDVHSSPIVFKGQGHLYISCPVTELADFSLVGVYSSCKLINVVLGFCEALVSGCSPSSYYRDEAVGDSVHSVLKVTTLVHVEDRFGRSRGDWWVVSCRVRCDMDLEWGRGGNLLHRWSGGVGDILDRRCH